MILSNVTLYFLNIITKEVTNLRAEGVLNDFEKGSWEENDLRMSYSVGCHPQSSKSSSFLLSISRWATR